MSSPSVLNRTARASDILFMPSFVAVIYGL
jgi:hypothetical protein